MRKIQMNNLTFLSDLPVASDRGNLHRHPRQESVARLAESLPTLDVTAGIQSSQRNLADEEIERQHRQSQEVQAK